MNKITDLYIKRQMLQLIGQNVRTYSLPENTLISFARKKALKLKEDITFYTDETKTTVLFNVKARNIIDIAPTFDVIKPDGNILASLRRKGIASTFVQDTWLILGPNEEEWGMIQEESSTLGVLRRYVDLVSLFFPQQYDIFWGQNKIGEFKQNKNPFTLRLTAHYHEGSDALGEVLKIAIPNLFAVIEGKQ